MSRIAVETTHSGHRNPEDKSESYSGPMHTRLRRWRQRRQLNKLGPRADISSLARSSVPSDVVRAEAVQDLLWQVEIKRRLTEVPGTQKQVSRDLGIPVGLVNRLARRPFSTTIVVTTAAEPVTVTLGRSELEEVFGSPAALDEAIVICTRYDSEN